MNIKEALYRYLQTVPDLTNIVGTKIYRDTVPLGTVKPYIYYLLVTGEPNFTARIKADLYQFSIYAETSDDCDNIYNELFKALQNKGTLIGGVDGKVLISSKVITDRDASEFETKVYQKIVDIKITYWR